MPELSDTRQHFTFTIPLPDIALRCLTVAIFYVTYLHKQIALHKNTLPYNRSDQAIQSITLPSLHTVKPDHTCTSLVYTSLNPQHCSTGRGFTVCNTGPNISILYFDHNVRSVHITIQFTTRNRIQLNHTFTGPIHYFDITSPYRAVPHIYFTSVNCTIPRLYHATPNLWRNKPAFYHTDTTLSCTITALNQTQPSYAYTELNDTTVYHYPIPRH